jgi:CxxC motif-containing protein (DUF1111 family)
MRIQVPLRFSSVMAALMVVGALTIAASQSIQEAPTGFTTPTGCPSSNLPPGVAACSGNGYTGAGGDTFASDQQTFEEQEGIPDGLGPVYNDKSCANCHQNPVTGGVSEITELRVGHTDRSGNFVNPSISINGGQASVPNRSLVNDRAICPQAQELAPLRESTRTLRLSLNILGDGFVEAIDDATLIAIARSQVEQTRGRIHGQPILVPVLEASGATRVGRFGWKDQHASLLSFSGDAYINEMGITNRLNPTDMTEVCKMTADIEDHNSDIDHFADFMRATNAPPRDAVLAATPDSQAGERLFNALGCALCHVTALQTAPPGTSFAGGTFVVSPALGGKMIHPYSDFLLHDVGTGDGIVQNGPPETASKLRTPPLWGLRTHTRLMHDGASLTRNDAILRHAGEAADAVNGYRALSRQQRHQLLTFLDSL